MDFIAKSVVTKEGISKLQIYRFVGMKGRNWEMVDVEVWDWEYSKEDIENSITQLNEAIAEREAKLALFE